MDRLKEKLQQFLKGRYGSDSLNNFLLTVAVVGLIVTFFPINIRLRSFLSMGINLVLLITVFRSMSRNLNSRYQENIKYLNATKPIRAFFQIMNMRIKDRDHRYIRCPNCKNYLRTPKDVGKIKITCNHCGNIFKKWV